MPSLESKDDSLRVVLASSQKGWGGGEAYLLTLAKGLRDSETNVQLIARKGGTLAARATAAMFDVLEVRGRGFRGRGFRIDNMLRIRRLLAEHPRTVLHCNDTHAFRVSRLAAIGLAKVRVVSVKHTIFPVNSPRLYRKWANRLICVSHAVADICRASSIPDECLRVVHAGLAEPEVDAAAIARARRELLPNDHHQLIVAVGNLLPCKGHETLVRAVAKLKLNGLKIRAVIAGDGKQRQSLQSLIQQLDLESEVTLLGFRDDPETLIAATDVFAHPSHQEGLCLVVAAAMMLKRPLVTTAVGPLTDHTLNVYRELLEDAVSFL